MQPSWTGGQYSLYRMLLGVYLSLYFCVSGSFSSGATPWLANLIPTTAETFAAFLAAHGSVLPVLRAVGVGLSLLLALGKWDRLAAWLLFLVYPRQADLSFAETVFPVIPFLLVMHIFSPAAPYGSWAAYGRQDPAGKWRLPPWIPSIAWLFLAAAWFSNGLRFLFSGSWRDVGWTESAADWVQNPLGQWVLSLPSWFLGGAGIAAALFGLAFAPLCLNRRGRLVAWLLSLALLFSLLLTGFAPNGWGLLLLHLLIFNPAWLPAKRHQPREIVFYDGHCGLCHRFVRFLLSEDAEGELFRLSPLGSGTFHQIIPPDKRADLPDSVILATESGSLRTRSRASFAVLDRLGGYWRILSWICRLPPAKWMDRIYNAVASIRHRLFKQPEVSCPILPPHLHDRFEL